MLRASRYERQRCALSRFASDKFVEHWVVS